MGKSGTGKIVYFPILLETQPLPILPFYFFLLPLNAHKVSSISTCRGSRDFVTQSFLGFSHNVVTTHLQFQIQQSQASNTKSMFPELCSVSEAWGEMFIMHILFPHSRTVNWIMQSPGDDIVVAMLHQCWET